MENMIKSAGATRQSNNSRDPTTVGGGGAASSCTLLHPVGRLRLLEGTGHSEVATCASGSIRRVLASDHEYPGCR
ncbi:Hypothetical predicted protein [Pelobates cultripes]|uniref:Uncharacterized protein n=1 Tax=Pelobates cultripes TaxID=61616 RepID=A0AAD1RU55_PELCU|nr:Hypothetical predicted protein [Pelobates cultripes]